MSSQWLAWSRLNEQRPLGLFSPPGGLSSVLSPAFLSSRKWCAESCSRPGLPPPPRHYSTLEFPPPIPSSMGVASPLKGFLGNTIPTLEEAALRAGWCVPATSQISRFLMKKGDCTEGLSAKTDLGPLHFAKNFWPLGREEGWVPGTGT